MDLRVLITGASGGIGRAIDEKFRAEGYETACPSRKQMDLRSPESIQEYVSVGQFWAVINCAGVLRAGPTADMSDEDIVETLKVNLAAPLMVARAALPKARRVVNISSVWSVVSRPGRAAYSASKAGLDGLTRALALEYAESGVLVNSVAPGYIDTKMMHKYNTAEDLERIRTSIPLGRFGEPADVAELVFFLGSEKNRYVTGQVFVIDGGFSVQ